MAYINDLFKILVKKNTNKWPRNWAEDYKKFTNDIATLKERLKSQPDRKSLIEKELYKDSKTFSDYPSFLRKLLYERANGISSRGQSVLPENTLESLISDKEFHQYIFDILVNPSLELYNDFIKQWKSKVGQKNWVLINRAFAASIPDQLTSTVDGPKFFKVLGFLRAECGYNPESETGNWYEANVQVTKWLDDQLKEELNDESFQSDLERHIWRNIFYWLLHEFNPGQFALKKQLVKYGAPGTGKTYGSKRQVANHFKLWKATQYRAYGKELADHVETVQFHPSYTYEDFLEGIRPVLKDGKTELKLTNGIFKRLCKKAAEWEMNLYQQMPELTLPSNHEEALDFRTLTVDKAINRLKGERWKFLQDVKDKETLIDQVIPPFYFIIDEINRAELSRVLGELMYCLEYRGLEGKIKTQYSSLVENEGADTAYWYENGENYFFIPHNVYIIGTMNNIDRSVESFDFALRRRFQWQKVVPDYDAILNDDLPDHLESLGKSLEKLNSEIKKHPLLGEDYQVGHSYFMNRPAFINKMSLKDVKHHFWNQNVRPLLEEYLRGTDGGNSALDNFCEVFMNG